MKGFTFIELMLVGAVISFLTVAGYERLEGSRERARRAAVAAEEEAWRSAAALYQFRNDGARPSRPALEAGGYLLVNGTNRAALGARAGGGR